MTSIDKLKVSQRGNEYFCIIDGEEVQITEASYRLIKMAQPTNKFELKKAIQVTENNIDLKKVGRRLAEMN